MSVFDAVGSLIGAGASLWEGSKNRKMQKEFAQNGIRWKVADAQAAGIHPLYALGAQTHSFAPVVTGVGDHLARMGQDIGRAVNATKTQEERVDAYTQQVRKLTLEKFGLENTLLASQIAKLNQAGTPPPFPSGGRGRISGDTINVPGLRPTIVDPDRDKNIRLPLVGDMRLFPGASAQQAEDKIGELSDILYGAHYGLMALGQRVDRLVKSVGPWVRSMRSERSGYNYAKTGRR